MQIKDFTVKIINGKLLKIKISVKNEKIEYLQIFGDFFLYPEDSLPKLEKALIGKSKDECFIAIQKIIKDENINIIGFSPEDINKLIHEGFK